MYTVKPQIVLREEFDDWAVLFNPDTGQAFGLNPTSIFVWKCLEKKLSLEEIEKQLPEHFSGVRGDAAREVRDFIEALISNHLVGCKKGETPCSS